MAKIEYRESVTKPLQDKAAINMSGGIKSRTLKYQLYTRVECANWAAQRVLAAESYPVANLVLPTNRDLFRLQPGDPFLFSNTLWNITNMICRVVYIEEGEIESGQILVHAVEDTVSMMQAFTVEDETIDPEEEPSEIDPIAHTEIIEAPYAVAGDNIDIVIPLAARTIGDEVGYSAYFSNDGGVSYEPMGTVTIWNVHGHLNGSYSSSAPAIDDVTQLAVTLDGYEGDYVNMESISRANLCGSKNLFMLKQGSAVELLSFQTVTPPVSGKIYTFSGLYRARFDTKKQNFTTGADFWYIGDRWQVLGLPQPTIPLPPAPPEPPGEKPPRDSW